MGRQKAAVLSHGQQPQPKQQKRTAATPLFDTERTEAEMKLSAQLGPSDEQSKDICREQGRTPWNKGQARPADVRQRIAEGVRAKNRERFLEKLEALNMTEEEYERQKKDERNRKAAERRARQTEKGGFRPTDETRQKISAILKAKWANGEMPRRRLILPKCDQDSHSAETRAKISASLRKKWDSDAAYRESMMNKTTVINARGDMRQKISETLKAKWLEPDFREKMMEKIRNRRAASNNRDDDYRRKISEAMKAKWQDDDYRNKTTSSIRQRTSVMAKARPEKEPKKPKRSPRTNPESKVRLAQVVGPAKTDEVTKRSPRDVDEDGQPIVKAKVKKVRKVKKAAVKMAVPLTSNGIVGSADDPPVKKKAETAKKVKEPDGSINRLRDERRDLYDLLYGDDEDLDSVESPPAIGISAMLDLEDADLDTYDPYGLEDF
ncbi:Intron-encoded nuclease repeat 2 [Fragilaria crotonensis]|nr:Intron-encoded nuclease repeat 2 [Fragilaria crotonensis]